MYPPSVVTAEQRRRWDLCHQLATTISKVDEPGHLADPQFVWHTERSLYASDLPTGDDPPEPQE